MNDFSLLTSLPPELLTDIVELLSKQDLSRLNLASRWCHTVATPLIWRHVELTDCSTRREEGLDQHDDTPWIKKLLILIGNKWIAGQVQSLTHRCHLPPPGIFHELPATTFSGVTLSADPRTTQLVQLAAQYMTRVHTLRIIMGHPAVNDALIRCFFDVDRQRQNPVRRLWLENCRIDIAYCLNLPAHPLGLPQRLSYHGLESIRFRRLPMRPCHHMYSHEWMLSWVHARGVDLNGNLQDGTGSYYDASVHTLLTEMPPPVRLKYPVVTGGGVNISTIYELGDQTQKWDDRVYDELADQMELPRPPNPDAVGVGYVERHMVAGMEHVLSGLHNWNGELRFSKVFALTNYMGQIGGDSDSLRLLQQASNPRSLVPTAWQGTAQAYSQYSATEWDRLHPTLQSGGQPNILGLMPASQRPILHADDVPPIPAEIGISLLAASCSSLTSVCLDWVFTDVSNTNFPGASLDQYRFYVEFFALRFPHLKAFQFRNNVVEETMPPRGIYLLDVAQVDMIGQSITSIYEESIQRQVRADLQFACLRFMEAHSKLQCLAWPIDAFFSPLPPHGELAQRIDAVIENLARNIVDLRVDTTFRGEGERLSDKDDCPNIPARQSRRQFIERFAARMRKIQSIKMEGGIPRDERREMARALHSCPLQKIVMIGVSCPLGNTWGEQAQDLLHHGLIPTSVADMEGEDKSATYALGSRPPQPLPPSFRYEAVYGWPPQQPLLHTLASHHAATVTELKFCGFQGAPILFSPTPITTPLLTGLRAFEKLRSLILSASLDTVFEGGPRDAEIISYWLDARSPTSTSLVHTGDEPSEPGSWEQQLRTRYAPAALAGEVVRLVGQFLAEGTKAREGGCHVRASICIGEAGGIFDIDLSVGKGEGGRDVCLGFEGPREEGEPGRRAGKEGGRRWF